MNSRRSIWAFIAAGLAVALLLAFLVSPLASSEPDGLERVAIDQGFAEQAADHALGAGPLVDYGVAGVESPSLSTGLAGVIGVALCFLIAWGLLLAVRAVRRRSASSSG